MKNSSAPLAALLISAHLLAGGCAARPADFGAAAKGAAGNADLLKAARESEQFILITVDAGRRVFFRREQVGTCDDVGPLKEKVRRAVEKNRRAARDRGDKESDASADTVFICAPRDLKYGDVVKVVEAIREAGGKPVGLDTECRPPG